MANNVEKKITKAMKFGAVADYFAQMDSDMAIGTASVKSGSDMVDVAITVDMIVEAMKHEVGLLTKKNSGSGKLTERQKENQNIQSAILDYMEDGQEYTVTMLIKGCEACAGMNNQRVSALVRKLIPDMVTRREDKKGVAWFSKVTEM